MENNKIDFSKDDIIYVGFWARVGASILDSIALLVITSILLYAFYGSDYFTAIASLQSVSDLGTTLINNVLPILLIILFWIYKATTPGKMVVTAIIVDYKTGGKPSAMQCIIRYIGYYISLIPLGLGFIWIAFDAKKQGWHDKIAGTVVVRVDKD